MSLIKEIENKAAQYNFSKDNLLERFTAIVAVPTRKGIEDWEEEIFIPEEECSKSLFIIPKILGCENKSLINDKGHLK